MAGPFAVQYGGYQYQSPETRALSSVTPESYDYRDQSKLLTKLISDTSYMAAYMKKMQKGIDQANQNFIQQIQGLLNEMQVLFAGGGDTGYDFGDLKYIFEAIGALFGWQDVGNGLVLPLNLQAAAQNFMNQYVLGTDNWNDLMEQNFDQSIATMLDVFGEIPVAGQAAQQLAVILTRMHDDNKELTSIINKFFASFNITPQNPLPSIGDWFQGINQLYTGLEKLFGGTDYDNASPIFNDIARWDQQVIDAIAKLTYGDWSGLAGLIPISKLTNALPDQQVSGNFTPIDSIAANTEGWSRDANVGRTSLGSAKVVANGLPKALAGTTASVAGGQKLTPSIWVKWSSLAATGDAIILQLRCNTGQDIQVAKITNPSANADWVQLSGTITIPTGVSYAKPRIYISPTATSGNIWFDDASTLFDASLLPQDWIANLPTQWDNLMKLWGFQTSDLQQNVDPNAWWQNAINELFPPIPQDKVDQLNDFWDGVKSWLGLDHITDIPSIDPNWWTNITNSFLVPGNILAPKTVTNQLNSMVNQIGDIFNNSVVTPINQALTNVYNWWTSQTGPNSLASKTNAQLGWWQRLPENILISLDALHLIYPLGSPNDGPLTTIGGKRTWYAARADLWGIKSEATGAAATPDVLTSDIGTFALTTQTRVITNESTLAQVQADVDALKTNDNTVAGKKYLSTASGGSDPSWGSNWTVTATNSNISPKSDLDTFSMNLASSSLLNLKLTGRFNAGVTLTDNQILSLVFQDSAQPMGSSSNGPQNTLKGRLSNDGQNYIYVRIDFNQVSLGYAVNGIEQTPWAVVSGTVPAGSLVELYLGSKTGPRNYLVRVNGSAIIALVNGQNGFSDTSSLLGDNFRGGGQDQLASRGSFNELYKPARTKQFKLQDSNVQSVTYGTSARWYRSSTAGYLINKGAVVGLGSAVYDTNEYASSDLKMTPVGIAIYTPGRYRITHAAKISSATASPWAWNTVSGSPAYASINQVTAGPNVVSKASSKYEGSPTLGLGGSFSFNAVGDGGETEIWSPSIACTGSGQYSVLGDGAGEGTWVQIERIG